MDRDDKKEEPSVRSMRLSDALKAPNSELLMQWMADFKSLPLDLVDDVIFETSWAPEEIKNALCQLFFQKKIVLAKPHRIALMESVPEDINSQEWQEQDAGQRTAFHYAAIGGSVTNVGRLIKNIAPLLHIRDSRGCTVLWYAAFFGRIEILNIFIKNQASLSEPDNNGCTPIMAAADKGQLPALKLLFENGASLHSVDKINRNALANAVKGGHLGVLQFLLKSGLSANHSDYLGMTPVLQATYNGTIDTLKLLLDNGGSLQRNDKTKRNALMLAVSGNQLPMAEFLLKEKLKEKEFSLLDQDDHGTTVLHIAVIHSHGNIVPMLRLLLQHRADLTHPNVSGLTQIAAACTAQLPAIQMLLQNGACLTDTLHHKADDILFLATRYGHFKTVGKWLLDNGVPFTRKVGEFLDGRHEDIAPYNRREGEEGEKIQQLLMPTQPFTEGGEDFPEGLPAPILWMKGVLEIISQHSHTIFRHGENGSAKILFEYLCDKTFGPFARQFNEKASNVENAVEKVNHEMKAMLSPGIWGNTLVEKALNEIKKMLLAVHNPEFFPVILHHALLRKEHVPLPVIMELQILNGLTDRALLPGAACRLFSSSPSSSASSSSSSSSSLSSSSSSSSSAASSSNIQLTG